jgi:hypothetical protein
LNIHGQITNLVNNEQLLFTQGTELVRQPVLEMRFFELLNQCMTVDVVGGKPVLRSRHTQGAAQMRFAYSGWSEEDYVLSIL